MSDYKKEAKAASAAKMQRMGLKLDDGSKSFTDERGGSPFEGLNSGNAGKMPITPSRFKRGGKVAHVVGKHAAKNLGKSARKGREHHSGLDGVNRVGRMMNTEDISDNIPPQQIPMPTARPKNLNPVQPQIATNVGQFNRNPAAGYPLQRGMPGRGDGALNLPYSGSAKKPMHYIPPEEGDPGSPGYGDKRGGRIHRARGGLSSMNPAKRKAAVGAMVARKNKAGAPSAPPSSRGILSSAVNPSSGLVPIPGRKHGGAAKHPDVAEDRKLVKQMVKPSALKDRAHKLSGGRLGKYLNQAMENYVKSPDDPKNKQRMTDGVQMAASKISGGSGAKVPATYKEGGRAHKLSGGALVNYINSASADMGKTGAKQPFDFNRASKRSEGVDLAARKLANQNVNVPASNDGMNKGGRAHRASGGRTKGKTNVNIIISPQSGQGQSPLGAGVGMGQPPVPPMMPPVPPQMPPQGMMPPGAMPPAGGQQLPPQLMAALAAKGGAGGLPPMARKSGGRVGQGMPKYQEEDYGSGSGLGRLEKKKWPTANGTE